MTGALVIALPLILAGVLSASAVAKFVHPDDLAGWAELGVPSGLRKEWLVRLHPWGELALALALALLGGVLGLLAALAALLLMGAYLALIVRARRLSVDATCACFGASKPVTRVTVARNAWLTALALAAAGVIWVNPLWGGAVSSGIGDWDWLIALAVAAVTTALILWVDGARESSKAEPVEAAAPQGDDEPLDYIRVRTPAVTVRQADGTDVNIRDLAARKPILLLALSEWCGPCMPVHEKVEDWRLLLPEVDVRLLLQVEPEAASWAETSEPQSLHDPRGHVRASIDDWGTPAALLLGIDGWLAGGPVRGADAVMEFIDDVYESLHGYRPSAVTSDATGG